jgi:cytochrome c-type biogenesis protein CcmE
MVVAAVAPILALAAGLFLYASRDSIVFFYGPSEAKAQTLPAGRTVRIGGMVQKGSLIKSADGEVRFAITDNVSTIKTVYKGALPDLFREGQGVVAEGMLDPAGDLQARTVLAKHDERYMPREVVQAMKKSGEWQRSQ